MPAPPKRCWSISRQNPEELMSQKTSDEWQQLLAQADKLSQLGTECAMCGGTGGWPGPREWVPCVPCNGTGSSVPVSASIN